MRRSYDRLISTKGFPILVRWHLYIESGPWNHISIYCLKSCDRSLNQWEKLLSNKRRYYRLSQVSANDWKCDILIGFSHWMSPYPHHQKQWTIIFLGANQRSYWGLHKCNQSVIIGSANSLSPVWCQVITWTNVGLFSKVLWAIKLP